MSTMVKAELKTGVIYGDPANHEYVYMPASEIGLDNPMCVLEKKDARQDISLADAVTLVRRLSLKPSLHPFLGKTSC